MSKDLSLANLWFHLVRMMPTKVGQKRVSRTREIPKTQKSPGDCSILIVDNSNGYICVEILGGYIPISTAVEDGRKRYLSVSDGSPIVPDPRTPIIDDGACYSAALTAVLGLRGYYVNTASSGLEASNMVKEDNYGLIIMGSQIKDYPKDKPSQEGAKRFLKHVLKYGTNLAVILTVLPEKIEPINTGLNQMLNDSRIRVLKKPYEIPPVSNGVYNSNQLLNMVRMELGIRPK